MQMLTTLLPFVAMLVLFYLIIFVPENKRKKKYKAMLENLKVNDEIVTRGGIMGKVINIQDDAVIVQTGPDKAKIKLAKNGISVVFNKKEEETQVNTDI